MKTLKSTLLFIIFLAMIVGGRGFWLANYTDGYYPLSSFFADFVLFGLLMLGLYILNIAIESFIKKLLMKTGGISTFIGNIIVLIVIFPIVLVGIQLHPQRIISYQTPEKYGIDFESIEIKSGSLTLSGWFLPAKQSNAPCVIVVHGLNASKGHFLLPAKILHSNGFNVLLFDMRSHGHSDGQVISFGINEADDVKAAYDWVKARYPSQPVFALGYSMGGAAVLFAAAQYGIFEKIILDATFSRVEHVAKSTILKYAGPLKDIFWKSGKLLVWAATGIDVSKNQADENINKIGDRQLMLIHGTNDKMIPYHESQRLHALAKIKPAIWLVNGKGHTQAMTDPKYESKLIRFYQGTRVHSK